MLGTDKCKIQVLHGAPRMQQLSSNVKDGAWLVGGLRYMTTAVFLATPRVLSGQVPSRGPEIQPPGLYRARQGTPRSVSAHRPQLVGLPVRGERRGGDWTWSICRRGVPGVPRS